MKKTGFTLVETLVAITILVMAIVGATSAIQTGISSFIFSKDQIIAFNLAQEGFEQIRLIRSENSLNNRPWLSGLDVCLDGKKCRVDVVVPNTSPVECVGTPVTCPLLRQNPATGFFGYDPSDPWKDTIFRRTISLTRVAGTDDEVSILVTVDWSKGLVQRQFKARENLLNWQQ